MGLAGEAGCTSPCNAVFARTGVLVVNMLTRVYGRGTRLYGGFPSWGRLHPEKPCSSGVSPPSFGSRSQALPLPLR